MSAVIAAIKALAPSAQAAAQLEAALYRAHAANRAHTARRQLEQQTQSALTVIKTVAGAKR